jgi:hypothetical protein
LMGACVIAQGIIHVDIDNFLTHILISTTFSLKALYS